VADAPVEVLLPHSDDLAKGWLLALLEQAPLDRMPSIIASDLAQDGPLICAAIVRALADDADLQRLEPHGALEPLVSRVGAIAGASGPEATAAAVDALGAVIWSALRVEIRDPDPDLVSALAERLGLVMALVRSAALRSASAIGEPVVRRREEPSAHGLAGRAAGESAALWVGAIEEEIEQSERSGADLSLLLVELDDADRVAAIESSREASATFGRFAQALRSALRREDILACETDARAWIIARDTGRDGAEALAERVAAAVREAPPWRGAPLTVAVGVAVLGEDGRDVTSLIDAVEESRFAAAASGAAVASSEDDPGGGPPDGHGPRLVG
jgi:GGDEF domain-containing protein